MRQPGEARVFVAWRGIAPAGPGVGGQRQSKMAAAICLEWVKANS